MNNPEESSKLLKEVGTWLEANELDFHVDSDNLMEIADSYEHIIYKNIEATLAKISPLKMPLEQNAILIELAKFHEQLRKLQIIQNTFVPNIVTNRDSIWIKNLSTRFNSKEDITQLFHEFIKHVDLSGIDTDQMKFEIYSSFIKILSRPIGQELIQDITLLCKENGLRLSMKSSDVFNTGVDAYEKNQTSPKTEKNYYLDSDTLVPGPDKASSVISIPRTWESEFSILSGIDKKDNSAVYTFLPGFLALGHELVHAKGILSATSRGRLESQFPLEDPRAQLYPGSGEEELWVIEDSPQSENKQRKDHDLLSRSGHCGIPLFFTHTSYSLPRGTNKEYISQKIVSSLVLTKLRLNDPDFKGYWLKGLDFRQFQCQNYDFSYADLAESDFSGADLRDTKFSHANLLDASFKETKLEGSDMSFCQLTNTDLRGSEFKFINFIGASFKNVVFPTDINIADLIKYNLDLIDKLQIPTIEKQKLAENLIIGITHQLSDVKQISDFLKDILQDNTQDYKLLRRETDIYRAQYGNTRPWNHCIMEIKTRLLSVLKKDPEQIDTLDIKNINQLLATRSDRYIETSFFKNRFVSEFNSILQVSRGPSQKP